jgi:hypothetical protein
MMGTEGMSTDTMMMDTTTTGTTGDTMITDTIPRNP